MKILKLLILIVVIAGIVFGFMYLKTLIFNDKDMENLTVTPVEQEMTVSEQENIYVFVPDSGMKNLIRKKEKKEKKEIQREKLEAVFDALKYTEGSIIPKGTKIKNIFVDSGVLYINFNREIYNFDKNSSTEMMLVYSIVNTFCASGEINKVKFLIDGEEADTLGGYVSLKNYFERDMLLVQGE